MTKKSYLEFQALMPFASSPTFGFVYRSTVAYFPQAFLLLIAAVKLLEGSIVAVVNYGMRKERVLLEKLDQEKEAEKLLKGTEMKEMNRRAQD